MRIAIYLAFAASLTAQMRDNREKQLSCENRWSNNSSSRSCKMSEQTLPVLGRLSVDAGHNGGVSVRGWAQSQTLVRAKVEAWAPTESEASLLAGQVQVETASGLLRATGPETRDNRGWAVSWEVFAPHATDLTLTAHNGGVHISDMRGRLAAKTHNGGVHFARVAGEVSGASHNGGIHVEMASAEAGRINLETYNGGVHLALARTASARVHAETNNGGIRSDFPMPETSGRDRRPRNVDFTIGSCGPAITVKTNNGGVHLERI